MEGQYIKEHRQIAELQALITCPDNEGFITAELVSGGLVSESSINEDTGVVTSYVKKGTVIKFTVGWVDEATTPDPEEYEFKYFLINEVPNYNEEITVTLNELTRIEAVFGEVESTTTDESEE